MNWICPKCGKANPSINNFCEYCGISKVASSTSRFSEKTNADGSKIIYDYENGYTINYTKENGYKAYNAKGEEVYHIYPDGKTSFKVGNLYHQSDIVTSDALIIEDVHSEMKIVDVYGDTCYISNGILTKKVSYSSNGSISETAIYNENGDYRREFSNGDIWYMTSKGENYKTVDKYGNVIIHGLSESYSVPDTLLNSNGKCYVYNEELKTYKDGKYVIDTNGDILIKMNDGSSYICNSYGVMLQKTTKDGVVYDYNAEKDSLTKTINGKKSYSKINHIEYDEESYNAIITSLNSVGSSYQGVITSACSSIESAVNSFPDSYSSAGISSVGSSVEGHIGLISSLGEMTNYSILAYQTCDDELKEGLYVLIDSLFGEKESNIANKFMNTIKNTIEDRDNDSILEYKKDTNFKILSENAIVDSTIIDEKGNKWYLNKNNTVIGLEGSDIKISYGGETFSLTYNNSGFAILKDSSGKNIDIFGDYNIDSVQFGGSQCDLESSYNNIYVNNILDSYFPGSTMEEKMALLSKAGATGCGYTSVTNFVFKYFEGNEQGFYKNFGLPMYEIKCNKPSQDENPTFSVDYNYEPVIMDLYCETNSESGKYNISDTTKRGGGVGNVQMSNMGDYLKNTLGIDLNDKKFDIKFVADDGYNLYNLDGTLYCADGGAHGMTIVGQNESDQTFVSTWGKKLIYEKSANQDYIEYYDSLWNAEIVNRSE